MEFVLVLFIYAGTWSDTDSVTLDHIYGFKTKQLCEIAGRESQSLVSGTKKELRFKCLEISGVTKK